MVLILHKCSVNEWYNVSKRFLCKIDCQNQEFVIMCEYAMTKPWNGSRNKCAHSTTFVKTQLQPCISDEHLHFIGEYSWHTTIQSLFVTGSKCITVTKLLLQIMQITGAALKLRQKLLKICVLCASVYDVQCIWLQHIRNICKNVWMWLYSFILYANR